MLIFLRNTNELLLEIFVYRIYSVKNPITTIPIPIDTLLNIPAIIQASNPVKKNANAESKIIYKTKTALVRGGVDAAALEQARKEKPAQRKPKLPEEFNLLKDHLSSFFNTKVQLVCNEKGKGKITIPFASEDELEKLIGLLDKLK